jgi:hypothetical protein
LFYEAHKIALRDNASIIDGDPEAVARPYPRLDQDTQEGVVYVAGKSPAQELMIVNRVVADEKPLMLRIQARAPNGLALRRDVVT